MGKGRLEAFSDGVLAILITIMVLELHVPRGVSLGSLRSTLPTLFCYLLSYIYIGIYWNNHHHLLHATEHVSGAVLWANLHLLFWLSLVPFATEWMGQNQLAPVPVAAYGLALWGAAVAFSILVRVLIRLHGSQSRLARAVGSDRKGLLSLGLYTVAIPLSFASPALACGLYAVVAAIWLLPDRRIERRVTLDSPEHP